MKILHKIELNDLARKYSHAEFKSKAWREYGLGDDGYIYLRGPSSGYTYSDWKKVTIAGIPLTKDILLQMVKQFFDIKVRIF